MVEKKKKTAAATAKHHFSARDPTYELGAQGQVRHIAAFSIVYVAIIALMAVLWDGLAIEFHGAFDYSSFDEDEMTQLDYCTSTSDAPTKYNSTAVTAADDDDSGSIDALSFNDR